MAESATPTRGMIVVGDVTTAGGVVIAGSNMMTLRGRAVALDGHTINCPACNSIGHIQLVPPFAGAPVDGVEIALSDDLCICGCTPPPRLISSNIRIATHGFSPTELADPAAASWLAFAGHDPAQYALPFDEQFLLEDAHCKALATMYFSVKLPTGKIVHGITSGTGLTERYKTEGAAHIEVYLGHIGTKFPQPLAGARSNIHAGSVAVARTDRLAKPWNISDQGLDFLGVQESGVFNGKNFMGLQVTDGMILTVYNDSRNLPTVGMGHLVQPDDNLKLGDAITLERAREIVRKDLRGGARQGSCRLIYAARG